MRLEKKKRERNGQAKGKKTGEWRDRKEEFKYNLLIHYIAL